MQDDRITMLEQELYELESYINEFWRFLPVAVFHVSQTAIITDADYAAIKLLGYPEDEILGRNIGDFFAKKADHDRIQAGTFQQGGIKSNECLIKNQQGTLIPVLITTQIRKDKENNIFGYFLSMIDITERKHAEEKIQEKITELEEFHNIAVGRELKMIELEKEINALLKELGKEPKYK
ncbi:MAG: PAS domain-containing protein [Candidatus Margulisbacteria bacterium]|nr:PAS domain-containing protein [Candidatus Margulisiibacteriota bacterium]